MDRYNDGPEFSRASDGEDLQPGQSEERGGDLLEEPSRFSSRDIHSRENAERDRNDSAWELLNSLVPEDARSQEAPPAIGSTTAPGSPSPDAATSTSADGAQPATADGGSADDGDIVIVAPAYPVDLELPLTANA